MATATAPKLRSALKRSSPSLGVRAGAVGRGPRGGGRHRRGRPGLVGRAAHRRRRRRAAGPPGLQGPRLQAAHRARARGAVRPHRRVVRRVGGRATPPVEECDALGMSAAQRLAAKRAIDGLGLAAEPDQVLLDGNWDFVGRGTTIKLVKGDARCLSIAAASILAKVTRDRMMRAEAAALPRLRLRAQQGLPVPPPQAGAGGLRPHRDPPPQLGVHGPPGVDGLQAGGPDRRPARSLRERRRRPRVEPSCVRIAGPPHLRRERRRSPVARAPRHRCSSSA